MTLARFSKIIACSRTNNRHVRGK